MSRGRTQNWWWQKIECSFYYAGYAIFDREMKCHGKVDRVLESLMLAKRIQNSFLTLSFVLFNYAIVSMPVEAYARNMFPSTDRILKSCRDSTQSDASLSICMDAKFQEIERRRKILNHVLLTDIKKQSIFSASQFYDADKAWEKYRNLECNVESDSTMGTVGSEYEYECLLGLDIQRIDQVQFLIDRIKEIIEDLPNEKK